MNEPIKQDVKYFQEDEIDLRELFNTILKRKKFILIMTFCITFFALIFALSKPNIYESKTILMPQETTKASVGGGLAALAGIAGVNLNNSAGVSADVAYNALLNDYSFMKNFVLSRGFHLRLNAENVSENYKFAFGFRGIYSLFNGTNEVDFESLSQGEKDDMIYETILKLEKMISISKDTKTSLLTISVQNPDASLAKEVVISFLEDASTHLKNQDMKDNEKKIDYYDQALYQAGDISLKTKLSELSSALIEKKVLANSNEFYNVSQLTQPDIAYHKDKVGPKRALILVVSFVTGFILSVFLVFFLEFIKRDEKSTFTC